MRRENVELMVRFVKVYFWAYLGVMLLLALMEVTS